jgi:GDP-L-fucose synthase
VPALIAKSHAAKVAGSEEIVVWGTGSPRRELLEVDDLADALIFLLRHYSGESHVNVGVGDDITVRELAESIMRVVGVRGRLRFDPSKPDGTPRKLLDSSQLLSMGWRPRIGLEEGLRKTYDWYLKHVV